MMPSGLPVSGTPDHVLSSFSQHQHQQQQQTIIGHGALAARISHHLRATSRARSVSPPPFEVELLSPKPLPSPKLTAEEEDPFAAHTTHKRRSLSVVKLEEMAARAEAEANNAAQDKTLPAPPVPSRRLLGAQETTLQTRRQTSRVHRPSLRSPFYVRHSATTNDHSRNKKKKKTV